MRLPKKNKQNKASICIYGKNLVIKEPEYSDSIESIQLDSKASAGL